MCSAAAHRLGTYRGGTFAEHIDLFRGTPSRYWLESTLADLFEVPVRPSAQTADDIYDQIAQHLSARAPQLDR